MRKYYKIILLIIVCIILFKINIIYNIKKITKISSIPGTSGINYGHGTTASPKGVEFSFSISPSGRYLLFLKEIQDSKNYPNTTLILKDLLNNEEQEIIVPKPFIAQGFSKDCWTIDEKFCYQILFSETELPNYTREYITIKPEFTYVGEKLIPGPTNSHTIQKIDSNYCSDCPSKDIIDSSINKLISNKGENFLLGKSYSVGNSGIIYYTKNTYQKSNAEKIIQFNPINMTEKEIFSTNAKSNVCLDNLTISPDETKIAFSRETQCGIIALRPELHVFDIQKMKDINYGKMKLGFTEFSWSPDSKSLYFVLVPSSVTSILKKINFK